MHLNVRFSDEAGLKQLLDFLYDKSKQGVKFTGLMEIVSHEVTIVTAIHNIKSNKGSKTSGVDKIKMDKYLQMPKEEVVNLIQQTLKVYRPKPAKRVYIDKSNGKKRPLGIPTILDRIIQECVRIVIEPICEAQFYPYSYGFRPYRAQKHAVRDIINVINAAAKSPDQPVWALEGDIKGCFDNINHRLLLQKLWRMGIHDKRLIKIIELMLKSGYIEYDMFKNSNIGTMQGGIISPLLANVYLNDFDWYVGRKYCNPHRQCKYKCNDTRRLKWSGVNPTYNFRYADDWVILTFTKRKALCNEIRDIRNYSEVNARAAQIQYINSVIMGIAEYISSSICSHALHVIDRRVNDSAFSTWKRMYPKQYNTYQIPLEKLSNLPQRHEGYKSTTFAIPIEGKWFGITMAFITHSKYEAKPFNQKMTPYTAEGRRIYVQYRKKHKPLPCNRPSVNTSDDIRLAVYSKGIYNFEYFMNREYAINRDKWQCKCCKINLGGNIQKHCHHVNNKLPIDEVNKVSNLAWICVNCHRMIHNSPIPENTDQKMIKKINKYREKLK